MYYYDEDYDADSEISLDENDDITDLIEWIKNYKEGEYYYFRYISKQNYFNILSEKLLNASINIINNNNKEFKIIYNNMKFEVSFN